MFSTVAGDLRVAGRQDAMSFDMANKRMALEK